MPFYPLHPPILGQLTIDSFLSLDECWQLVASEGELGLAAGATESRDASLRQSEIAWLAPDDRHRWLFDRVKDCIRDINRDYFGFHLIGFEGLQFTRYTKDDEKGGGYYAPHKDTRLLTDGAIRKLSFTIQSSDATAYEGGDLVLYDSFEDSRPLSRACGSINFFPSYTIHEVTPVTRGVRYSLVGWACGPAFV